MAYVNHRQSEEGSQLNIVSAPSFCSQAHHRSVSLSSVADSVVTVSLKSNVDNPKINSNSSKNVCVQSSSAHSMKATRGKTEGSIKSPSLDPATTHLISTKQRHLQSQAVSSSSSRSASVNSYSSINSNDISRREDELEKKSKPSSSTLRKYVKPGEDGGNAYSREHASASEVSPSSRLHHSRRETSEDEPSSSSRVRHSRREISKQEVSSAALLHHSRRETSEESVLTVKSAKSSLLLSNSAQNEDSSNVLGENGAASEKKAPRRKGEASRRRLSRRAASPAHLLTNKLENLTGEDSSNSTPRQIQLAAAADLLPSSKSKGSASVFTTSATDKAAGAAVRSSSRNRDKAPSDSANSREDSTISLSYRGTKLKTSISRNSGSTQLKSSSAGSLLSSSSSSSSKISSHATSGAVYDGSLNNGTSSSTSSSNRLLKSSSKLSTSSEPLLSSSESHTRSFTKLSAFPGGVGPRNSSLRSLSEKEHTANPSSLPIRGEIFDHAVIYGSSVKWTFKAVKRYMQGFCSFMSNLRSVSQENVEDINGEAEKKAGDTSLGLPSSSIESHVSKSSSNLVEISKPRSFSNLGFSSSSSSYSTSSTFSSSTTNPPTQPPASSDPPCNNRNPLHKLESKRDIIMNSRDTKFNSRSTSLKIGKHLNSASSSSAGDSSSSGGISFSKASVRATSLDRSELPVKNIIDTLPLGYSKILSSSSSSSVKIPFGQDFICLEDWLAYEKQLSLLGPSVFQLKELDIRIYWTMFLATAVTGSDNRLSMRILSMLLLLQVYCRGHRKQKVDSYAADYFPGSSHDTLASSIHTRESPRGGAADSPDECVEAGDVGFEEDEEVFLQGCSLTFFDSDCVPDTLLAAELDLLGIFLKSARRGRTLADEFNSFIGGEKSSEKLVFKGVDVMSWLKKYLSWCTNSYMGARLSYSSQSAHRKASGEDSPEVLSIHDAQKNIIFKDESDIGGVTSVVLSHCNECEIYILAGVTYVKLIACDDCTVVLCGVKSMINLLNCSRTRIHAVARFLKLENSVDIEVFAYLELQPLLIGDTRGITLGPYNVFYRNQAKTLEKCGLKFLKENVTNFAYPICRGPFNAAARETSDLLRPKKLLEPPPDGSPNITSFHQWNLKRRDEAYMFHLVTPEHLQVIYLPSPTSFDDEKATSAENTGGGLYSELSLSHLMLPKIYYDAVKKEQTKIMQLQRNIQLLPLSVTQRAKFEELLSMMLADFVKKDKRYHALLELLKMEEARVYDKMKS